MGDEWFFDRLAPVYDRLMPPTDRESIETGLDCAAITVETIIDLAGGSGRIARRLVPEYDVTVVDLSRSMLQEARRHRLDGVEADATRLPIRDDAVDAVVIADAYHHLVRPDVVLAEVVRILAPGGVLVVREFNPATVRGKAVELSERALGWPSEFRTPPALAADLEHAGFDVQVLDSGFGYTVAGVVPESRSSSEASAAPEAGTIPESSSDPESDS